MAHQRTAANDRGQAGIQATPNSSLLSRVVNLFGQFYNHRWQWSFFRGNGTTIERMTLETYDVTTPATRTTLLSVDSTNNGNVTLNGCSRASTTSTTGALVVPGGVGIGGDLNVAGQTTFGTLNVSSALNVTGTINTTNATASTSTTTGALTVTGGAGIGGQVNAGSVNTAGTINTTNATASTSPTTGALTVTGGAGVGGSVFTGGSYNISRTVSGNPGSVELYASPNSVSDSNVAGLDFGFYSQRLRLGGFRSGSTPWGAFRLQAWNTSTPSTFTDWLTYTFGSGGQLTVHATQASTSTTTGALVVGGGVGVTGNVNVSGNVNTTSVVMPSTSADRKVVLWSNANVNNHQYLGFGVGGGELKYQVDATTASHIFYAGTSTTASNELCRITGTGSLTFPNALANRKVVLWSTAANDHQFYGLGLASGTLRYQVDNTGAAHVFYAGTSTSASNELFRISGGGGVTATGSVSGGEFIAATLHNTGGVGGARASLDFKTYLVAGAAATSKISALDDAASGSHLVFYTKQGANATAPFERMRITSTGHILSSAEGHSFNFSDFSGSSGGDVYESFNINAYPRTLTAQELVDYKFFTFTNGGGQITLPTANDILNYINPQGNFRSSFDVIFQNRNGAVGQTITLNKSADMAMFQGWTAGYAEGNQWNILYSRQSIIRFICRWQGTGATKSVIPIIIRVD